MIADHCTFKFLSSPISNIARHGFRSMAAAIAVAAIAAPLTVAVPPMDVWAQTQTGPARAEPRPDATPRDTQAPPASPGTSSTTPSKGLGSVVGQPAPSATTETGPKDGAGPVTTPSATTDADMTAPADKRAISPPSTVVIEDPALTALRLITVLGKLPKGADVRLLREEMLPLPALGATTERSGGLDPAEIARLSSGPRPGLPADPNFENPAAPPRTGAVAGLPGNEPGATASPPSDGSNVAASAAVSPTGPQRTDGTRAPTGQVLSSGDQRPREVIVVFAETSRPAAPDEVAATAKIDRESTFETALSGRRIARYRVPDDRNLAQILDLLGKDRRIVSAQPNYIYKPLQGAAGTSAAGAQYAAQKLRLAEAHRLARGRNVKIALIDTGVDTGHPELAGVKIELFDATGTGRIRADAHGTAMLGILAARKQLVGMAPDASILAARAVAPDGEGTTESVLKALAWSFSNGARIINLSLSGPKDPLLQEEIATAITRGAIIVAAAGNGGDAATAVFPAAYDGVIAVTAVDANDRVYAQANRGSYIALAAPGVDIPTLALNRTYQDATGTSYAAAHVSGVIALLLEKKPELKSAEVRDLLMRTARKPAIASGQSTKDTGSGIVDPVRALESLR